MSEQNKALARRWFQEVWNENNESAIDQLFHPDGKCHGWPRPDSILPGPAAFKEIHRLFTSAFSDIHIDIDDIIAEDDRVAIRWSCIMKHTGDSLGFRATHRRVALPGSSFITCHEGRIVDGWNFMDLTKVIQDLQDKEDLVTVF